MTETILVARPTKLSGVDTVPLNRIYPTVNFDEKLEVSGLKQTQIMIKNLLSNV